ncbi:heme exporter protein CcmD [Sandarakinorhabdus oryzae]|uniref:heme exporter protein CcmD n=1 Tax=Sandarakinorhabdus oryzae TaxID=2675220 RepID=UPI0012E25DF6|nr:heme exporter protein CcmD [Sandarakinorhabdus oryzae]
MTDGVVARPDLWANFIWPAYAITLIGLVGLLLWAFVSMRSAEKKADEVKRK